jgi:hypothetical protein
MHQLRCRIGESTAVRASHSSQCDEAANATERRKSGIACCEQLNLGETRIGYLISAAVSPSSILPLGHLPAPVAAVLLFIIIASAVTMMFAFGAGASRNRQEPVYFPAASYTESGDLARIVD